MLYAKISLRSENRFFMRHESVPLTDDFITLGQLLKLAGAVQTGGEAKYYLREHDVLVNGSPEKRRGRKLRPGDAIAFEGVVHDLVRK